MTALLRRPLVQVLRNVTGPPRRTWSAPQSVHGPVPGGDGGACGLSSLTAIWGAHTDLTVADLEALGVEAGWALSSESTIRRVLQDLDPADVDAHLRPWLCTRTGTIEGRTVAGVVSHYLLTVKGNQKTLRRMLKRLPQKSVPSVSGVDTSHGRRVRRTVKAVKTPARAGFPAAVQVVRVRRTRATRNRKKGGQGQLR